MKASAPHVFFAVSGKGLGNIARQHGVIQSLCAGAGANSLQITLATWGVAYDYAQSAFRDLPVRLVRLEPYSGSPFRPWRANCRILRAAVEQAQPAVAVLDSDYHFPAFRRVPTRLFVSQCAAIVAYGSWFFRLPARNRLRFLRSLVVFELFDFAYQRLFADHIVCPAFEPPPFRVGGVTYVEPIVRAPRGRPDPTAPRGDTVAVLLSGSGIEKAAVLRNLEGVPIHVFERQFEDLSAALRGHAGIVTQGGFSSLSEMRALGKAPVILPIEDHFEQAVNAEVFHRNGWGVAHRLGKAVRTELADATRLGSAAGPCEGAEQVADVVRASLCQAPHGRLC